MYPSLLFKDLYSLPNHYRLVENLHALSNPYLLLNFPFQGSGVRQIWAHRRLEFGVVRPNI